MSEPARAASLEHTIVEHARREGAARQAAGERRANGSGSWLAEHWLAVVNTVNALVVAGTVFAPWLRARGDDPLAALLYGFYWLQCPQRPDHSFYLFGQKMGMEQRMVALYAGWLLAGLAFVFVRGRMLPLTAVAVAGIPMGIDVGSQMVGLRESSGSWRVATGTLFAVVSVFWAFPRVDAGMRPISAHSHHGMTAVDTRRE